MITLSDIERVYKWREEFRERFPDGKDRRYIISRHIKISPNMSLFFRHEHNNMRS